MREAVSGAESWPRHATEVRDWRQSIRGGGREDRMLRSVTVSIPPRIAHLTYTPGAALTAEAERALVEVTTTDAQAGAQSRAQ